MSMTNFDLLHADQTRFIGLDNYVRLTSDPLVAPGTHRDLQVRRSSSSPSRCSPASGFALLAEPPAPAGKGALRTLVYMPIMIPLVASTLVWTGFLNTETGWLNKFLGAVGTPGPDWINSEVWIYPALTLMGLWAIGNFMIINIAGLQSVPTELYEAARIDGAGWWTSLRRITIPLMSPVLLYDLVIIAHRDVPVLHPGLHADERPRRPEQRDVVHQPRAVPRGVRVQPDGLRRGDRLAAVRHRRCVLTARALPVRPQARLLRRRRAMTRAARTAASLSIGDRSPVARTLPQVPRPRRR